MNGIQSIDQHAWANMAQTTILRSYAVKRDPVKDIPSSILFAHTDTTLTIFDAYPKSIFHFLILPRPSAYTADEVTLEDLDSLKTVLQGVEKEKAKRVVLDMEEAAKECVKEIEEEMVARYGFKWNTWIGFHPVPSMKYVVLYVFVSARTGCSLTRRGRDFQAYSSACYVCGYDGRGYEE